MSRSNMPSTGDIVANRYRLGKRIGSGGFGVIFEARQSRKPHRVALKLMSYSGAQVGSRELKRRFRREAVMASNLIHPHAVRQFDFGDDGDVFYLAMELLEGQTLGERIEDEGPLSTELVIRIARAALEVLHLAHQKDIVHRDLKPHNIMLCHVDGDPNFPKVLDFGAAKTTHGQHDLTSAGIALGSPAYMAPEILRDEDPLPASDLYSLGITLGEAIAGEMVVPGDDAIDRARNQLSPETLNFPDQLLQSPLYPWLAGALQKDLDRRVSSAHQMLCDLDELERKLGVAASSSPSTSSQPLLDTDFSAESTVLISKEDNPVAHQPSSSDDFNAGPTVVAAPDEDTSPMMSALDGPSPPSQAPAPLPPQQDDAPTAQITNPLRDLFPDEPSSPPTPPASAHKTPPPDNAEEKHSAENRDSGELADIPHRKQRQDDKFENPAATAISAPTPEESSQDKSEGLQKQFVPTAFAVGILLLLSLALLIFLLAGC